MRAAAIIVAVLLLDVLVLFVGRFATMHANQVEIMRALAAQSDAPGPDAQRRVDAAFATAHAARRRGDRFSIAIVLLVTCAGGIAVKRSLDSRPVQRSRAGVINT